MKKYIFLYEVGIGDVLSHKIESCLESQKENLINQLSFQFKQEIENKYIGIVAIPCEGVCNKLSFQEINF